MRVKGPSQLSQAEKIVIDGEVPNASMVWRDYRPYKGLNATHFLRIHQDHVLAFNRNVADVEARLISLTENYFSLCRRIPKTETKEPPGENQYRYAQRCLEDYIKEHELLQKRYNDLLKLVATGKRHAKAK